MSIWTTPERLQLRKTVRSFAEREILPHVTEWERDGELPRDLHRRAAEAGLLGAELPESVGGGGGDAVDSVLICEELHEAGTPGGVFASLFTCGIASIIQAVGIWKINPAPGAEQSGSRPDGGRFRSRGRGGARDP